MTEPGFPTRKEDDAGDHASAYLNVLAAAATTISRDAIREAAAMVLAALERDAAIFSCGNGGSCAIANHLLCDWAKGVATHTDLRPRVTSLSQSSALLTAIGNDLSFEEVFAHQLRLAGRRGDLLVTISSSGNSENIVRAIHVARELGMTTISLTGFAGGRSRAEADVNIHVDAHNYGVVEDLHQSVMHIIAQYLRQSRMPSELVREQKF